MRKFTLLFFTVVAFIGLNAQENLVLNGGFEDWKADETPENWIGVKTSIDSTDVLASADAYEGDSCLNLINTGTKHKRFTTDSMEVKAGISYQISFMVKGVGFVRGGLYDTRTGAWPYGTYEEVALADNWKKVVQVFTAKVDTTAAEFIISIKETDVTGLFIDSVAIIELKNAAEIIEFNLDAEMAPAMINSDMAQVTATVLWGTEITALTPEVIISEGAEQVTPTTTGAIDFTNDVKYIIEAEDGTEKIWNVTVVVADEPDMVSVYDIQYTDDESGDSPLTGQLIQTKGVVTAIDSRGIYIQDGAGAYNGVYVFNYNPIEGVAIGDSVKVIGEVDEYNNLTELTNLISVTVLNSGNELPAAAEVTSITDFQTEAYEGVLTKVVEEATSLSEPNEYGNWEVESATGTLIVRNQIFEYTATVGTVFNSIIGIGSQYKTDYQLMPTQESDYDVKVSVDEDPLALVKLYPNPVKTTLNVDNLEGVSKLQISNVLGQTVITKAVNQNRVAINTSEFKAGVYVITLVSENGNVRSERFIKD